MMKYKDLGEPALAYGSLVGGAIVTFSSVYAYGMNIGYLSGAALCDKGYFFGSHMDPYFRIINPGFYAAVFLIGFLGVQVIRHRLLKQVVSFISVLAAIIFLGQVWSIKSEYVGEQYLYLNTMKEMIWIDKANILGAVILLVLQLANAISVIKSNVSPKLSEDLEQT